MKKLCSLALALCLLLALTGCVYESLLVAVRTDGSGTVELTAGVTEEALQTLGMEDAIERYALAPFTQDGVTYYGLSERDSFATLDEANALLARIVARANALDEHVSFCRACLLRNSDGSLTLSLISPGVPDLRAAFDAAAGGALDEDDIQTLLAGVTARYTFAFDAPVRQVVGAAAGVSAAGGGVMVDLLQLAAGTYQFTTTTGALTDTAYPGRLHSVVLDGVETELAFYALRDANGNETNYVMLRNIAAALAGTQARFAVNWDGAVLITRGTDSSGLATAPFTDAQRAILTTPVTYVDGALTALDAIVLTDGSGGGYTYYKLRDLGNTLGFNVYWDPELSAICVQSDRPYTGVKGE